MPVRTKSLPLLAAGMAVAGLAGCPSVDQTGPATLAVATFDTTTGQIPLPNDLAMQQAPALPSGLQRELLLSFIEGGGFPSDQESAITIPISVRTRNADGSYSAPAPAAGLDLATVNDGSVALYRIDVSPPLQFKQCPRPPAALTVPCWEASYAGGQLTLRRNGPGGSRRWDSGPGGARYVAATRDNITTSDGVAVGADTTIALAAANTADLSNVESLPNSLTPAQVAQLRGLRGILSSGTAWARVAVAAQCAAAGVPVSPCWFPAPSSALPSALAATELVFPRTEIASLQTFTIQGTARPLTDPTAGVVPLPSDFLLDPATGKVRNVPAFGAAAAGLATLDGFSTTAPFLIPLGAPVDATTITPSSVLLIDVTAAAATPPTGAPSPVQLLALGAALPPPGSYGAILQPPGTTAAGQTSTIVIAPAVPVEFPAPAAAASIYLPPLKQKSRYLVVVTNGVKDVAGNPLRRSTLMDLLVTLQSPLCVTPAGSSTCKSQVPGVSDADAAGLQGLRGPLVALLEGLHLRDCSAGPCAALAYTVKTQTVSDVSVQLAAAPFGIELGSPSPSAIFTPNGTATFDTSATFGIPAAAFPSVARFVQTTVPLIDAIDHTTGGLDPSFSTAPKFVPVPVLLAVPRCATAPSVPCLAPLVLFHHGLNGSRYQMLTLADSLAARGFVVAAADMPYHGERAFCSANNQCTTDGVADGVCTPNPALATAVDTAVVPGTCTTGKPRLSANLSTVASGNFFVSANFFRIRDAIRQDLLDQAILGLALARPPAGVKQPAAGASDFAAALATDGIVVNPTTVYYGGISLGGIVGTSVVATNPRFKRAALSVPGGTLVDVFTTSPAFQANLVPLFASLGIDLPCVQAGTGCDAATRAAQTAAFQQTLAVAKWVLDPAEPLNYAANVVNKLPGPDAATQGAFTQIIGGGLGSATTDAFGQIVANDQVVPNPTNRELNNLAKAAGGARYGFTTYTSAGGVPAGNGHGLLNTNFFGAAAGPQVALQTAGDTLRTDFGAFLESLTLPAAAVDLP